MTRRLLPLVALVAALSPATPAGAAEFTVGPSGTHATIADAVAAARATGETDRITIAPGIYEGTIHLGDPADAGLTIVGAGASADPAVGTILRPSPGYGKVLSADHKLTLRSLLIEHPGLDSGGMLRGGGVNLYGAGSLVEDVAVEIETETTSDNAFDVRAAGTVLRRVRVDSGGGLGVYTQDESGVRIEDSELAGHAGFEDRSSDGGPLNTLVRTRVLSAPDAEAAVRSQSRVALDSSLVVGGLWAVSLVNEDVDGSELVVRSSTLDAGARGVTDTGVGAEGDPHLAVRLGRGQGVVDSSVLFEGVQSDDEVGGDVRCEFSAVIGSVNGPGTNRGTVACPVGGQGNIAFAPALLSAPASGDYTLAAGSPARDAGRPGALLAGISSTDLAGRPRIAVPFGGCGGRLDMGAYEADAPTCPPVPPPDPPGGNVPESPPPPDELGPDLSELRLHGRRLRGRIDEAARLRVTVRRCRRGRCTRTARLQRALAPGAFELRLPARARRGRGRFAVVLRATDAAGNATLERLRFRKR